MTDPRFLSIISFVFALLAAYSLYTGTRQLRDARRVGRPLRWYKNLSLLTGIEYGLLTFVFLLRTATAQNAIAPGMRSLVGPLYLILLIPAAVVAAFVIRRVILNMRPNAGQTRRVSPQTPTASAAQTSTNVEGEMLSKQEQEEQAQRQRQRRRKAAAARRRQAGKA